MIFFYRAHSMEGKAIFGLSNGLVSTDFRGIPENEKASHLESLIEDHIRKKGQDGSLIIVDIKKLCD